MGASVREASYIEKSYKNSLDLEAGRPDSHFNPLSQSFTTHKVVDYHMLSLKGKLPNKVDDLLKDHHWHRKFLVKLGMISSTIFRKGEWEG